MTTVINENVLASYHAEDAETIRKYIKAMTNLDNKAGHEIWKTHHVLIATYQNDLVVYARNAQVEDKLSYYHKHIECIPAFCREIEKYKGKAFNRRITNAVFETLKEINPYYLTIGSKYNGAKEITIQNRDNYHDYVQRFDLAEITDEDGKFNPDPIVQVMLNRQAQYLKNESEIESQRYTIRETITQYNKILGQLEDIVQSINHDLKEIYKKDFNTSYYILR